MNAQVEEFLGKLQVLCAEYGMTITGGGCCSWGEAVEFWHESEGNAYDPQTPLFSSFDGLGGQVKGSFSHNPLSFIPDEES